MRELVLLLVAAARFPPAALTTRDAQVTSKGGGWTQADIRLAKQLLGWSPQISLPDSMRAMWERWDGDRVPGRS
jgi:nucleoside-diphosphate-sugar epimerase